MKTPNDFFIPDNESGYRMNLTTAARRDISALLRRFRALHISAKVDELYSNFESQRHWVPLINKAQSKMASRDLCFRDALHQNLVDHIGAVLLEDFNRFISERSMALTERIEQYVDALKRLKDRN